MVGTQRNFGIRHVNLCTWLRCGHNWCSAEHATPFTEGEARGLVERLNARPALAGSSPYPYYAHPLPRPEEGTT